MNIIPISASAGITGFESPAQEYHQLPLSLDELLIEHPSSSFIGMANGDSMEGFGIFSGDILIVDRSLTVRNNDIIVANYNSEFVCKQIDTINRRLVSANENQLPITINQSDTFSIEGVVIRSIRCHRPCHLLRQD